MKTIIFSTIFLWCFAVSAAAEAVKEVKQDVKEVKEKVTQQLDQLNPNAQELVTAEDLQRRYTIQVRCAGSINKEECNQGLRSLNQALANTTKSKEGCKCLNNLTIALSPLGVWSPATEEKLELKIPYSVEANRMTNYINRQVAIVFVKEDQEMAELNAQIEKEISDRYGLTVKSGSVTARQYYEGLKNVYIILHRTFGESPNKDDIQNLGYDGIVVSNDFKSLYEDSSALFVKVDYRSSKGRMFQALIHQIKYPTYWNRVVSGLPYQSESTWNIQDVRAFRASRDRTAQLSSWIKEKLPNTTVECVLSHSESNYVSMAECERGLSNLQRALMSRSDATDLVTVSKLLIVNPTVQRYYKVDEGTMALSYARSPQDILPLTQKQ